MTIIRKSQQYREYAEAFLPILEILSHTDFPTWVPKEIPELLEQIEFLAQKTIDQCTAPVKIGVMGEFSSGKTLLLGSLFGFANELPVSEIPTTGNVTAIHLIQQPELETTQFSPYTVSYLKHDEVKKHLRSMGQEIAEQAEQVKLIDLAQSLRQVVQASEIDIEQLLSCCKALWERESTELRSRLYELITLLRTYKAYGSILCGQHISVDASTVKQGLELKSSPSDILKLNFEQLPKTPKVWKDSSQPAPTELQQSFSLIRQIDVTVYVSKEVWDLSALKGTNEFIVLDFPGLNAGSSRMRDRLLSLEATKDVQTVLLVVNGHRPGGEANAIRTMFEKNKGEDLRDRIIVVVGRFNQIPLSPEEKSSLQALIEQETVSEEAVLEQLKTLETLRTSAINLTTQKGNIVLVSQLHGLAYLKQSLAINVCTSAFRSKLEEVNREDAQQQLQLWEQLSDRLPNHSILKRQLSSYVEDGGIDRLRTLLSQHVSKHGMQQLLEDTEKHAHALRQAQSDLKLRLQEIPEYIPVVEDPNFLKLREVIEALIKVYERSRSMLNQQSVFNNRQGVTIGDVVKDELRHRVFGWSEWNNLFKKAETGIIQFQPEKPFWDDDDWESEEDVIPLCSDDFQFAFKATLEQLQFFAQDSTKQALSNWLRELSHQIEPIRYQIAQLELPDFDQVQTIDRKQAGLLKALKRTLDPQQWQPMILEKSEIDTLQNVNVMSSFPLALPDERHGHQQGQLFAWNPNKQFPDKEPLPFNHLFMVIRVRDEMITSAESHLMQHISALTKQIKPVLLQAIDRSIKQTQDLLQPANEPFLKLLTSSSAHLANHSPAWLETLAEIPAISFLNNQ